MKPKTGERVLKYTTIVARAVVFHKSACASRGHTILYSSKLTAPQLFRPQTLTYDLGGIVLNHACDPINKPRTRDLISGCDFFLFKALILLLLPLKILATHLVSEWYNQSSRRGDTASSVSTTRIALH